MWLLKVGVLVILSFSVASWAQTPAKPKTAPQKKPAVSKPAPVKAEPVPVSAAPPPSPTDVQLRTKFVTGAQVSENSTYIQGARQRFEFPGITMIAQCDLQRTLQLHDATKRYMVVSTKPAASTASAPPEATPESDMAAQMAAMSMGGRGGAPPKPRGGVITETITRTDTGERQQMFGVEARHIKSVVARQPGEGACDTSATTVETDGWYVDLPEHTSCPTAPTAPPAAPGQQACTDRVVMQEVGEAKVGFAVSTVITTTVVDTKDKNQGTDVSTMSMEVIDLKVTSLDKALFDVPAGYTEVKDYGSLLPSLAAGGSLTDAVFGSITDGTSTLAPKKAGVIRIGIVTPVNKSGRDMQDLRLAGGLLAGFSRVPFEGLSVGGATAAELHGDASAKACDYILVSDVAELKTSKPSRVGGLLKRASGDLSAPTEVHEVRIDYKLYSVGELARPKMAASVKASSGGGFSVGSALRVAAFAGQMYMTMGMGSRMMGSGAFGGMGGLGSGILAGRMNPGMGAAMSILSAGSSMAMAGGMPGMPGMPDASGQKMMETVQDGLSKAAKQIADELKKGKPAANAQKK